MKATTVEIKYASLKAVQKFFGTKKTSFHMPTAMDLKAAGSDGRLLSLALLKFLSEGEVGKEFITKPIFSFGRVLIKFSKNAAKFALNQLVCYLMEYTYGETEEKRVQLVVAPPTNNDELEEFVDELGNLDELMGQTPAAAAKAAADDDDTDDEEE